MATSLSDLCSRPDAVTSFVMQGERRQTADRRRTRRGGRRADDIDAVADPVDLRAIAMRRASGARAVSQADTAYDTVTVRPADVASRRLAVATIRPTAD